MLLLNMAVLVHGSKCKSQSCRGNNLLADAMLPAALLDALEALSAVGARPTDVAWFHCRILTATVNRHPIVTPKPEKNFINLSSSVHRFDGSMWQNFRFKERSPHQEL